MIVEQSGETMQAYLDKKLTKHGWQWNLVSTLTEGIIRVQIAPVGPCYESRIKCFNAETLEEAANNAEKYVIENKIN